MSRWLMVPLFWLVAAFPLSAGASDEFDDLRNTVATALGKAVGPTQYFGLHRDGWHPSATLEVRVKRTGSGFSTYLAIVNHGASEPWLLREGRFDARLRPIEIRETRVVAGKRIDAVARPDGDVLSIEVTRGEESQIETVPMLPVPLHPGVMMHAVLPHLPWQGTLQWRTTLLSLTEETQAVQLTLFKIGERYTFDHRGTLVKGRQITFGPSDAEVSVYMTEDRVLRIDAPPLGRSEAADTLAQAREGLPATPLRKMRQTLLTAWTALLDDDLARFEAVVDVAALREATGSIDPARFDQVFRDVPSLFERPEGGLRELYERLRTSDWDYDVQTRRVTFPLANGDVWQLERGEDGFRVVGWRKLVRAVRDLSVTCDHQIEARITAAVGVKERALHTSYSRQWTKRESPKATKCLDRPSDRQAECGERLDGWISEAAGLTVEVPFDERTFETTCGTLTLSDEQARRPVEIQVLDDARQLLRELRGKRDLKRGRPTVSKGPSASPTVFIRGGGGVVPDSNGAAPIVTQELGFRVGPWPARKGKVSPLIEVSGLSQQYGEPGGSGLTVFGGGVRAGAGLRLRTVDAWFGPRGWIAWGTAFRSPVEGTDTLDYGADLVIESVNRRSHLGFAFALRLSSANVGVRDGPVDIGGGLRSFTVSGLLELQVVGGSK